MNIIKSRSIRDQFDRYPDVEGPLLAWMDEVGRADWFGPQDVKDRYPSASFVADNCVVFNIKGNRYRMIVAMFYPAGHVYVKFFGTHAEYDRIDALTVDDFRGH